MPLSQKQSVEFTQLIGNQGTATRTMAIWPERVPPESRATIAARAERLVELATLAGHEEPERAVNDAIARWLELNPLVMTVDTLTQLLEPAHEQDQNGTTYVRIGRSAVDRSAGYQYQLKAADLKREGSGVVLQVPDSVAEHFRQQGRRGLQSELRSLLNAPRA